MVDNPYNQLVDTTPATGIVNATNRVGQAANTPQGGVVALGTDSSGVCRTPRVDSSGTLSVSVTNPSGGNVLVQGASAPPAVTAQYGNLMMARQDLPTPSAFYPVTLDQVGSVQAHLKSKVTFTIQALKVTCGANFVLLALINNSTSVLRMNRCFVYVPPSQGGSSGLLGSGLTYYPVFCELRRLTASGGVAVSATAGNALSPVPSDSADVLSSGISAVSSPTSVIGTASLFHQADCYSTNMTGIPFYERGADPNAKTFVIRPSEGACVVCTSPGIINSTVSGSGTVTAQVNIEVIFTQCAA